MYSNFINTIMKKYLTLTIILSSLPLLSQIGINNTEPKSTLDITAHANSNLADGVILPQLTLQELTSKGNTLYTVEHKGTLIYINDISSGDREAQRTNITSIGIYYFDGFLWQKLNGIKNLYNSNSQITSDREVNLNGKTLSFLNTTGDAIVNQFSVGDNVFSVDALNNRVGIGTSNPVAKVDARTNPTSTTNPGVGAVSIGTAYNISASAAGAGAVRYNTISGGVLQYSDGVNWYTLKGNTVKAKVVATKTSSMALPWNVASTVTDWTETIDNLNMFDADKGEFTAPRKGNYMISFSYGIQQANFTNQVIEAQLRSSRGPVYDKKSVVTFLGANTNVIGTANVTFVIHLDAGEIIFPAIYHNSGGKQIITEPGYNNFSVVEL